MLPAFLVSQLKTAQFPPLRAIHGKSVESYTAPKAMPLCTGRILPGCKSIVDFGEAPKAKMQERFVPE